MLRLLRWRPFGIAPVFELILPQCPASTGCFYSCYRSLFDRSGCVVAFQSFCQILLEIHEVLEDEWINTWTVSECFKAKVWLLCIAFHELWNQHWNDHQPISSAQSPHLWTSKSDKLLFWLNFAALYPVLRASNAEITKRFIVWGNDSARITSCRISSEARRGQFIASSFLGGTQIKGRCNVCICVLDPCSTKKTSSNKSHHQCRCPTEAMAYSRSRCWDSKTRPKITTSASIADFDRFLCGDLLPNPPQGTAQPS